MLYRIITNAIFDLIFVLTAQSKDEVASAVVAMVVKS